MYYFGVSADVGAYGHDSVVFLGLCAIQADHIVDEPKVEEGSKLRILALFKTCQTGNMSNSRRIARCAPEAVGRSSLSRPFV